MSATLGDRIRSQAAIADRPGQMAELEQIAEEVEQIEERLPREGDAGALDFCRAAARDYINGRPRDDVFEEILAALLQESRNKESK